MTLTLQEQYPSGRSGQTSAESEHDRMEEARLAQLQQRWEQLLWSFQIEQGKAQTAFRDLVAAYSSPGRVYHTLDHIQAVLDWTDRLAMYAHHLPVIQLAAWLHDSIYDTHEENNEERSAAYAEKLFIRVGIPQQITRAVSQMILSTKTHWANANESDCHILLDADLAILGAPPEAYVRYAQAIRQEYSWVREEHYRAERKRVLEGLLRREHFYWTPLMREMLEEQARDNMRRECSVLSPTPSSAATAETLEAASALSREGPVPL